MRAVTPAADAPDAPEAIGPARLVDAVSLDIAGDSPTAFDPDLRVFTGDLVRAHGLPLDEDAFAAGRGQSFAEMGEAAIDALVPADRPVDLLIQVFAAPDVQPGRATSVHLSAHCPGRPFAFALCEQGTAGAFSALRLVPTYLVSGGFSRALVLVMEQAALHYRPPAGTPVPDRHTAVGLLCERGSGLALAPAGATTAGTPEEAAGQATAAWRRAPTGSPAPLLLFGAGLEDAVGPPDAEVLRARRRSPYTGLWSALVQTLPRLRAERRTLLAVDYDPLLGHLDMLWVAPR
ncbi:hypothetical protein [Streptomyces sp. MUM 16J]|uniref:hypothetical protein n=1 Tax=Streptomyces sp. MUM 16J TaxID=2791988 RepID=UPI00069EA8BB|nr:hypothetical protein [Streptomyces sp. MUM 16J]MCH0559321.1 hypothetical protein [Streptomyces sp. MUM 16J]